MKYYVSGQVLPQNVFEALRVTGKIGFLSRKLWIEFFAKGNERWNERQKKFLKDRRLLASHPNPAASGYYILTPISRALMTAWNLSSVRPAPVAQIYHDEVVARSILRLEQQGLVRGWLTENELKSKQVKQYQLSQDVRNQKYPDAVLKVWALGQERTFALEYERMRKASLRYKDILWAYSRTESLGMVIFICDSDAIKKTIKGRLQHLRLPDLWSRVAFTDAKDWIKNPSEAIIELGNQRLTLRSLCQRIEKKMA